VAGAGAQAAAEEAECLTGPARHRATPSVIAFLSEAPIARARAGELIGAIPHPRVMLGSVESRREVSRC
jgi:hypothetical protein